MPLPALHTDGWTLDDGEVHHREAPATFEIPPLAVRQALQPGDFAKLMFRIALDNDDDPEAVERMWVIVRKRTPAGYMGQLDNQPSAIFENDTLWLGTELPFEPRHIIDVAHATEDSVRAALASPAIPWQKT